MEPGEDGELEAQRGLHQWLCHERLAHAMALDEVQHHTLPGTSCEGWINFSSRASSAVCDRRSSS